MEPSGPDLADAGSSGPFWAGWCQPAKRANAARRRRGRAVPSGLAGPAVVATQHRSPLSRALRGPAAERLISAASRVSHLPPLYLSRLSVSRLSAPGAPHRAPGQQPRRCGGERARMRTRTGAREPHTPHTRTRAHTQPGPPAAGGPPLKARARGWGFRPGRLPAPGQPGRTGLHGATAPA